MCRKKKVSSSMDGVLVPEQVPLQTVVADDQQHQDLRVASRLFGNHAWTHSLRETQHLVSFHKNAVFVREEDQCHT